MSEEETITKTEEKPKRKRASRKELKPKVKKEPEVSFKYFFDRQVALGNLQSHLERELQAYCENKNLKSKETEATFQAVIDTY